MPDDVEPVIRGIQNRFRDLSVDVREERVLRYIVNQLSQGRHIDEILNDPYLTTHTSEVERSAILQNPSVIRAIEEEIQRQFASYKSVTSSVSADAAPEPAKSPTPGGSLACPSCGVTNTRDSSFCRRCGTRLAPFMDPTEVTLSYSVVEQSAAAGAPAPAAAVSGPVLLIRAGGGREGERISLGADVLTIGRSPQSDLFLDDVTVSRHHARVIADGRDYLVEDLNSLNGTYVNRKRIERHRLADGDEVQIGKYKLAFLEREREV